MIISVPDIWHDALPHHEKFLTGVIDSALVNFGGSELDRLLHDFILDNRYVIVNGSGSDLECSILDYESVFGNGALRVQANKKLKSIFDFESFSKKTTLPWTAYSLCAISRYKVCSYCQLVTTDTSLPHLSGKGYRPPIDHYYAKSKYPFLALTLANFIPCCEKCNGSQMKGMVDFAVYRHLNPLCDAECIEFSLLPKDSAADVAEALSLNLSKSEYRLELVPADGAPEAVASMKTFQLQSRYESYAEQAYYLAKRLRGLTARLEMQHNALDFMTTVSENLEFDVSEYKKTPYGKARVCIAKQFGVLS